MFPYIQLALIPVVPFLSANVQLSSVRVRALARICAQQYLAKREELGFPLLKGDK